MATRREELIREAELIGPNTDISAPSRREQLIREAEQIGPPQQIEPSMDAGPGIAGTDFEDTAAQRIKDLRLARLREATNDNFDPTQTFGADFDGFDAARNFISLFDLARSEGDHMFDEKRAKFKDYYPDGDIAWIPMNVDGSDEMVPIARANKADPWRVVSSTPGVLSDIFNMQVLGATAGSFVTPVIGTVLGSLAGSGVDTLIEHSRGFEFDQAGSITTGAGIDAAIEGGFGAVTKGVGRLVGPGPSKLPQAQVVEAIEAQQALGLPPLLLGEVSPRVSVRRLFGQVAMTSSTAERALDEQRRALMGRLGREVDEFGLDGLSDDSLQQIVDVQQANLNRMVSNPDVYADSAGRQLRKGHEELKAYAGKWVDRKYQRAFDAADSVPEWRLDRPLPKDPINGNDGGKTLEDLLDELTVGVLAPVRLPDGTLLRANEPLPAALENIVGRLRQLTDATDSLTNQVIDGETISAFASLKAFRSSLFDYTKSPDTQVAGTAKRLWRHLTNIIENPTGGGGEFARLHRAAATAHRFKEDMLDKSFVAAIAKTDTPGELYSRLVKPDNFTALQTLKRLLPKERFQALKDTTITNMWAMVKRDPDGAVRTLNEFNGDPRVLRLVLNKGDEQSLRQMAKMQTALNNSAVVKALNSDNTLGKTAYEIGTQSTPNEMVRFINAGGGKFSPAVRSAKAGVFRRLLDDATVTLRAGDEAIDPAALVAKITELKKNEAMQVLFTDAEWNVLENFKRYAVKVDIPVDAGGAIQAGEALAGATSVTSPARMKAAWVTLYKNDVLASILTRPASPTMSKLRAAASLPIGKKTQASVVALAAYNNQRREELRKADNVEEFERRQRAMLDF